MIIQSVAVKNFRCVRDAEIGIDSLTALVGPNGSGKSCFLRALDLFYALTPRFAPDDFYDGDTSQDIEITVVFGELNSAAQKQFAAYTQDGVLMLTKVLNYEDGKPTHRLHGVISQHAPFVEVRSILAAKELRAKYNEFRTLPEYRDLPAVTSRDGALAAMVRWENDHPATCFPIRDDGQFFGFREVGQGYLGRFTRFIFIPAVREAVEDAAEGRASVLTQLVDLLVRNRIAQDPAYQQLRQQTNELYETWFNPVQANDLGQLSTVLSSTLSSYIPNAGIEITWTNRQMDVPLPQASVKVLEDGYASTVDRAGHGVQRAFVLTVLQHLVVAQCSADSASGEALNLPNLAIAIEEPELYQHPNRQRHFAKVLGGLARSGIVGVASTAQIMYCTHSPLFVGVDRFDQVRALKKVTQEDGRPKATRVVQSNLSEVSRRVWEASGSKGSPEAASVFRDKRLRPLVTQILSEGFFADAIVLVEGEDDRAAVLGCAEAQGEDLEGQGIAVLPCNGKGGLLTAGAIFYSFGIPTFLMWVRITPTERRESVLPVIVHWTRKATLMTTDVCFGF
jgi:putative ATP-dependent endonuclease of OLD family